MICDLKLLNSSFKKIFFKSPFFSFESMKIVRSDTVSINFLSFIKDGKKSTFDILINDLAISENFGTINIVKVNCKNKNKKEYLIM